MLAAESRRIVSDICDLEERFQVLLVEHRFAANASMQSMEGREQLLDELGSILRSIDKAFYDHYR